MAINNKQKDDALALKRIETVGEYILDNLQLGQSSNFGSYLSNFKKNISSVEIKPLSLMAETVEAIQSNTKNFNIVTFGEAYEEAIKAYKHIFYHEEGTPDFDILRIVYLELLEEDGLLARGLFSETFYDCFSDKQNIIRFYQSVKSNIEADEKWESAVDYASKIRKFYFDDDSFMAAFRSFIETTQQMPIESIKSYAQTEVANLSRMNGCYNVSPADIAQTEYNLKQMESLVEHAKVLKDELEACNEKLKQTAFEASKTLQETIELQTAKLHAKIREENAEVQNVYDECLSKINTSVQNEIIKSTGDFLTESRQAIDQLTLDARKICANAAVEVSDLSSNADSVVSKLQSAIVDDEAVSQILENAKNNSLFLNRVNSVSAIPINFGTGSSGNAPQIMVGNDADDAPVDLTPVEMLDPGIPFGERFSKAMQIKNNLIMEHGESFHEKFDDVLIAVLENANPYLIGPSGCGKTYLVRQIGQVLGLSLTDIGYINEEYDILGFQTASGSYSKPNFYRCYKYGGIAFCDELDNGNSRASVKLNSFLTGNKDAYFRFPNGEKVERNPNFRFVSAGNTDGNGANTSYNSREKIEESVMQRLLPIYLGYDNKLEKEILKNYPEWFNFVCLFRSATTEWQNNNGIEASGIITTRDTARIKQYLDNKSFDAKAIIKYEFIQTKSLSYLSFLASYMQEQSKDSSSPLLDIFTKITKQYIKDGGWNR